MLSYWSTTVLLTYPKDYVLSLRLTYVKHVIVILFFSKVYTMFHHDT